jgi:hypothetical protein
MSIVKLFKRRMKKAILKKLIIINKIKLKYLLYKRKKICFEAYENSIVLNDYLFNLFIVFLNLIMLKFYIIYRFNFF